MATLKAIDKIMEQPIKNPNWQQTMGGFYESVASLPQVQTGAVREQQAYKWLEAACKQFSPGVVSRLIRESSEFNADEVRALWSFDNGEYYPILQASEVYALKNLEALKTPDVSDKKRYVLDAVFTKVALNKYGLVKASEEDIRLNVTSQPKGARQWMSQPTRFIATNGVKSADVPELSIVSLKSNYNQHITQSDMIRHHYHQLCLAKTGIFCDTSYQMNVNIDKAHLEWVYQSATIDNESFETEVKKLQKMESKGMFSIDNERICVSSDIYTSVLKTGDQHHQNILSGIRPVFKQSQGQSLTQQEEDEFVQHAKVYAIAQRKKELANTQFTEAMDEVHDCITRLGKGPHFRNPFPWVQIGQNNTFLMEKALNTLRDNNVDPRAYSDTTYDVKQMVNDLSNMGVDTTAYAIEHTPVKKRVIASLESLGFQKSQFTENGFKVHFTSQTRGPVKESVNEFDALLQQQDTELNRKLLDSEEINKPVSTETTELKAKSLRM